MQDEARGFAGPPSSRLLPPSRHSSWGRLATGRSSGRCSRPMYTVEPVRTLYARTGDWFAWGTVAAAALLVAVR